LVTQEEVGSEALAKVHKGVFSWTIDSKAREISQYENEHVVKKLVEWNFDNPSTCYIEAAPMADEKLEMLAMFARDVLQWNADPQVIESCKRMMETLGFELVPMEEVPEEEEEEYEQPINGNEPMPAGEGDTEFESSRWVTITNKRTGKKRRIKIDDSAKGYENLTQDDIDKYRDYPDDEFHNKRPEGGKDLHLWSAENIRRRLIRLEEQYEAGKLTKSQYQKLKRNNRLLLRKYLKGASMIGGNDKNFEAPAGWDVEFRELYADTKGKLFQVVDRIDRWVKGLDSTVRPYEIPERDLYRKVLEDGTIEAFDLAAKSQALEFGSIVGNMDERRTDLKDRVSRVVGKQFADLSFKVGNVLNQARKEKFFNYESKLADAMVDFKRRAEMALDVELGQSFRDGRDAVVSNVEFESK